MVYKTNIILFWIMLTTLQADLLGKRYINISGKAKTGFRCSLLQYKIEFSWH